jgi:hypothetical protein
MWFHCKKKVDAVEKHLERRLAERVAGFSMDEFAGLLEYEIVGGLARGRSESLVLIVCVARAREDQISSEMFELILSFGDFATFKDMMLSQKRVRLPSGLPRCALADPGLCAGDGRDVGRHGPGSGDRRHSHLARAIAAGRGRSAMDSMWRRGWREWASKT